jgi:hypothetical protein
VLVRSPRHLIRGGWAGSDFKRNKVSVMEDDDYTWAANLLLGMAKCGTLPFDNETNEALEQIVFEWKSMRGYNAEAVSTSAKIYSKLTNSERIIFGIIRNTESPSFWEIQSEWPCEISYDGIDKHLKNTRKKLKEFGFDFVISKAGGEVIWKTDRP